MKSNPPSPKGFTLVEILVTAGIVCLLAVLLVPALKRQIEKSQGAACQARLRQIGMIFQSYVGDHDMRFSFMRDGDTVRPWYTELKNQAGLSDAEARKVFGCPSLPSESVNHTRCYGFRAGPMPPASLDPGKVVRIDGTGFYELHLARVENPSRFFLMGDSGHGSNPAAQPFRIVPPSLYGNGGIKTRHQNRANILFLDGHMEALDGAGLGSLGFTQYLDAAGNPASPPES